MYKKISTIKEVKQFIAHPINLLYRDTGRNFFIGDKKISEKTEDIQIVDDLYITFFNTDYTKQFVYNLNTLELKEISKHIGITDNSVREKDFLSYYFSDDFMSSQLVLYNIEGDEIKKKFSLFNINFSYYFDEKVVFCVDSYIKLISLYENEIWQFPLSSLGGSEYEPDETDTVVKILGIAHGNLWIYTKFGRLVALDIDTGEFIKGFSYLKEDNELGYEVNEGLGRVYLHQDKNIYCMGYNVFTLINTESCSITERYNTLEADPNGIGSYRSVFNPLLQGDYFTFLGQKAGDYGGIGWVGIFDYKARKLVWEYEVITQEERDTTRNQLVAPQPLYMSGNKLYVKDIKDNLHIFEKE